MRKLKLFFSSTLLFSNFHLWGAEFPTRDVMSPPYSSARQLRAGPNDFSPDTDRIKTSLNELLSSLSSKVQETSADLRFMKSQNMGYLHQYNLLYNFLKKTDLMIIDIEVLMQHRKNINPELKKTQAELKQGYNFFLNRFSEIEKIFRIKSIISII